MKKIFLLVLSLVLLIITASLAHPPGEMTAQFELEKNILFLDVF